MTTRAARVNSKVEAPKTDIAPIVDITPETDMAPAETPKTDKAPITLESLKAAHNAAKVNFRPDVNKGDIVGMVDTDGEIADTGAVTMKPDMGANLCQVRWDRTGRCGYVALDSLTGVGDGGWIIQNG